LYARFLRRDPDDNGKFLTGVVTTGIYCLPSCPARRPNRENVRFFKSPDEARSSGLRPCRRCRPDSFYRGEEWREHLYEQTVERASREPASFTDVTQLAATAGLSKSSLTDLFRLHGHESPATFLRRIRIARACDLLRGGAKPIDAAQAAGFESSSAFHEQFVARTGLTPAAYAALRTQFTLRLPLGYRRREVLDFYGRDPQSVSESVDGSALRKCVLIQNEAALIQIDFAEGSARCAVDCNPYDGHRAALRILGLDSDAAGFERQFADDALLGSIITRQKGLRIPMTPEPWEALAWAIIGQQISLKFAVAMRRALIAATGALHGSGLRAHPSAEAVAKLDVEMLRGLRFSGSKAEYLLGAARAVQSGDLLLGSMRNLSATHAARKLSAIRGIGPWTVQYAFLRGIGFADCLPSGDAGLAQGLGRMRESRPSEPEIREIMARFSPWRSLATYHVWASLKGDC